MNPRPTSGMRRGNEVPERPPFWVTRAAARRALVALHVAAAILVLVELARPLGADGHGMERVVALDFPASYALYGFVACVVLVMLGRGLRRLARRDESYYERDR